MHRLATVTPLKHQGQNFSERQIILLDGIRYSADMAGIAIDRLWTHLCIIDQNDSSVRTRDIATAALDAWSIIDSAHRMTDLLNGLPGLSNQPWRKIFTDRVQDCLELRNSWQHQLSESEQMVAMRQQAWGTLAWVKHHDNRPTGQWYYAVAGTELKGSEFIVCGPHKSIPRVSTRRIRLLHAGKTIYLARVVRDMFEATKNLENQISSGQLRVIGDPVEKIRNTDVIGHMSMSVILAPRKMSNDT